MASWYIIGSLRNPRIPEIGNAIRSLGHEAFDDWYAAGPEADDKWKQYEQYRSRTYKEALRGYAAEHVFGFDRSHLDRCSGAILVLPAGRSGHLEFGYACGLGKPGYVLFDTPMEDARWDVMYQFAKDVFFYTGELLEAIKNG